MTKKGNIYVTLRSREYRTESNYRLNVKLIRNIVCQEDLLFHQVWHVTSKQPVSYECHGRDNTCQLQYDSTSHTQAAWEHVEDALTCMSPLAVVPLRHHGYRPHLLAVTTSNKLRRYDLETGRLLQEVYLGPSNRAKFKHLSWNTDDKTVVIKSTQKKSNQGGRRQDVLVTLVLMGVFPLSFICMMEITRKVFGNDVRDAMIAQDCLITLHQTNVVRVYSTEHILAKGLMFHTELYEDCTEVGGCQVGNQPLGLPLNIKLDETPDVLFEARCAEHNLTMGGFPWQYIALQKDSSFQVSLISSHKKVQNGRISSTNSCLEPDRCYFHPDESGRIVHVTADSVKLMKLSVLETLTTLMDITPALRFNRDHQNEVQYTSSGRAVQKRVPADEELDYSEQSIPLVDYENELDLLVVTSPSVERGCCHGRVCLYDNQTGQLVKTVILESWQEEFENTVILDLDTLVHLVKSPQPNVYVYHLDRRLSDDRESPARSRRRRHGASFSSRNNTRHQRWNSPSD